MNEDALRGGKKQGKNGSGEVEDNGDVYARDKRAEQGCGVQGTTNTTIFSSIHYI